MLDFIFELQVVDWLALIFVLSLAMLIIASEVESLIVYRRHFATAMLVLACAVVYIVSTTDSGDSVFFSSLSNSDDPTSKKRRKQARDALNHDDGRVAGEEASGPGDGDGGDGKAVQIALGGEDLLGNGGMGNAASQKKKGGGGKAGGKGAGVEATDGGGASAEDAEADSADKQKTAADGKTRLLKDCKQCPSLVLVPAGALTLGPSPGQAGSRPHEGPAQPVRLKSPYWVGQYEVTVAEFAYFVEQSRHKVRSGCVIDGRWMAHANWMSPGFKQTPEHPVVCVSHRDAQAYVGWLAKTFQRPYRLPSEVEWEYAARGGLNVANFPWDEELVEPADANYGLVMKATVPVGRYASNQIAMYDVAGNVWEMVEDCWAKDLSQRPANGAPYLVPECRQRVIKGGSWYNTGRYIRLASRWANPMGAPGNGIGFRVMRDILRRVALNPAVIR